MKPAARFLLLGLASVFFLAVAAAGGVIWQTGRLAQQRLLDRLQAAGNAESELQAARFRELQLRAEPLADDPAFVDYIAQSLIPNPKFGGGVDSASIGDILGERRNGFDMAIVLDAGGKPAATSGILLKDDVSIASEPLVAKAIRTLKPTQGMWADHGRVILVVANPLLKGGALQGVLLAGSFLDDGFANQIAHVAGIDIALFVPSTSELRVSESSGIGGWVASELDARMREVDSVNSMSGKQLTLSDGHRNRIAWVRPLEVSGDHAVLVALAPDTASNALIEADAVPMLYGLLGLWTVGSAFVLRQWSWTYVPLQNMMEIVGRAALGDQFLILPPAKGSPIVSYLREVINRLLTHGRK